ncbi:hypothetical protein ACRAWF_09075 [Streptomyces sp. L7]
MILISYVNPVGAIRTTCGKLPVGERRAAPAPGHRDGHAGRGWAWLPAALSHKHRLPGKRSCPLALVVGGMVTTT